MCMVGRSILIQGEARKNKGYRRKYFVLSVGPTYTSPRLDIYPTMGKWHQHRDNPCQDLPEGVGSWRSIDLSNLFFVDDVHRSKPKHGGLDLYKEDGHFSIILSSEEIKAKWKEFFENIVYRNGKTNSYPKIEHTLQVGVRLKPKDVTDKGVPLILKGDFRACFMKTSLMFVNKTLERPSFVLQYPFIRQWESRSDGTFRLEIGRAAVIGECFLVLQLADYAESKAAHAMLANCIKCFKMSRPVPPRVRNSVDVATIRIRQRGQSLGKMGSLGKENRSESYAGFSPNSLRITGSVDEYTDKARASEDPRESEYLQMNITADEPPKAVEEPPGYLEHISRIYQCPNCGSFTKVVTYCISCTGTSSASSVRMLCQTEALPFELKERLLPSIRSKAHSVTDRRTLQSFSLRPAKGKLFPSDTSQSFSKSSTNGTTSSSKVDSQISLSISANRHDDQLFMDLEFDSLRSTAPNVRSARNQPIELTCGQCQSILDQRSHGVQALRRSCSQCSGQMTSLLVPVGEPGHGGGDWIPRTTSLVPRARPLTATLDASEYVETDLGS